MPISPKTGAVASFADWNEKELLKTLKTVIQRLGGRDHGQEPSGLRHAFVCDTSRMYAERTEPRPNTAAILQATTCLSKPEVVDQTVHQHFRKIKDSMQMIAQTPPARSMFLDLVARQSNHSSPVLENFTSSMTKYREIFTQLGHKQFADSVPEPKPRTQPSKPPTLQVLKSYADGSSSTQVTELRSINSAPTVTNTGTARASLTTTAPDSVTAPTDMVPTANLTLQRPEQMMTQTEMADIEAELKALSATTRNVHQIKRTSDAMSRIISEPWMLLLTRWVYSRRKDTAHLNQTKSIQANTPQLKTPMPPRVQFTLVLKNDYLCAILVPIMNHLYHVVAT